MLAALTKLLLTLHNRSCLRDYFLALRALLLTADYFLGGVVAGALTKLLLRLRKSFNAEAVEVNKLNAEAMLYIVSILCLGESEARLHPRDDDVVVTCLKVLMLFSSGVPTVNDCI